MTCDEISKVQAGEAQVYDTAKQLRALLDHARKMVGAEYWDANDCEQRCLNLVSEEGE